jgi:DNA-binding transcriptional MerR regulator
MARRKEVNLDAIKELMVKCDPDNLEDLTGGELETLGLIGVLNKQKEESSSKIEQLEKEVEDWKSIALDRDKQKNALKKELAIIKPRYEKAVGLVIDGLQE